MNDNEKILADMIEKDIADAEEQVEQSRAEIAAAEEKQKVAEYEKIFGKIPPAHLEELRGANILDTITTETITINDIRDAKKLGLVAMCKHYKPYAKYADSFAEAMKGLNDDLVKSTKKDIEQLVKKFAKEHAQYNKMLEVQKSADKLKELQTRRAAEFEQGIQELEEMTGGDSSATVEEIQEKIRNLCEWNKDKNGVPISIKANARNADLIFQYDPNIKNLLAYEEFEQAEVLRTQPVWSKDPRVNEMWEDKDDAQLRYYLRKYYADFANEKLVNDWVIHYAHKNSYHVIKNYLENLPAWDGEERAATIFSKFLRVENTEYSRAITMNFFMGALARVFYPGCNFQTALVLHGKQGIGKSRIIKLLGGKWYGILHDRVDDSHALDTIRHIWICEIEEHSAVRMADVNSQKSFISRNVDTRRVAYAKRAQSFKRRGVFLSTCNDKEFLKDKTGNRRYLILECQSAENDSSTFDEFTPQALQEYFQQVWAEAFSKYRAEFEDGLDENKLNLPKEIKNRAEKIANNYVQDNGIGGEIRAFLERPILHKPIWQLLSLRERITFYDNGSIRLNLQDLYYRQSSRRNKKALDEFYSFIRDHYKKDFQPSATPIQSAQTDNDNSESTQNNNWRTFYGEVQRDTICAAEICAELYRDQNSKRRMREVNEELAKLDGWKLKEGKDSRDRNYSNLYGDQRKIYVRIDEVDSEEGKKNECDTNPDTPAKIYNADNIVDCAEIDKPQGFENIKKDFTDDEDDEIPF